MSQIGVSGIVFRKSGSEIKAAIANRCSELESRLSRRNSALDSFLNDRTLVRSFLVRSAGAGYSVHGERITYLGGADDISSEQMDEVRQMCHRILQLEQELARLRMIASHVDDDAVFDLSYDELTQYGFE